MCDAKFGKRYLPITDNIVMSSFLLIVLILLASSWSYKISSKSYQLLKHGKCNLKTDDRDIPRTSPITFQEIQTIAQLQGLKLVSSGLGPYLRLEAYSLEENEKIGYLTAFLRPLPLRLLHLGKYDLTETKPRITLIIESIYRNDSSEKSKAKYGIS